MGISVSRGHDFIDNTTLKIQHLNQRSISPSGRPAASYVKQIPVHVMKWTKARLSLMLEDPLEHTRNVADWPLD